MTPPLAEPVCIAGEEAVTVPPIGAGPHLEAMLRAPADPARAVLMCHAHPLYAGSMHCALIVAIAELLIARDRCAVLRFNYRGVGKSEGRYDEGRGETMDARAALRFLRRLAPNASLSVCGHSFGARIALRAAAAEPAIERLALLAPIGRGKVRAFAGDAAIFVGERDPHCTIDGARSLAEALDAELHVVEHADHFFLEVRSSVAAMVARHIAPEAA